MPMSSFHRTGGCWWRWLEEGRGLSLSTAERRRGLGYQWKRISKPHLENIDPDKEHFFLFGGGYERLQTLQSSGQQAIKIAWYCQASLASAPLRGGMYRTKQGGVSLG